VKLTDLTELIEAATIATQGVDLFSGHMLDDTSDGVLVRAYGGRPLEQTHDGDTRRFARVQVVVRDTDPEAAYTRAEAIFQLFKGTRSWDDAALLLNGTQYDVIVPLGELFPLTHDTSARAQYAANYEVRFSE
jgi:hypothetical protein